ncbi:MAG: hypothetical protein CO079_08290 [Nitrosopumilales archaeon CG_4_9_14_0_8_um_filter_34_10]|nr:MAG: hypothetical protein CO079_08290 [Nitrosopumilales archaeon CG_4_9_14_0_8_um_filter_34_10]
MSPYDVESNKIRFPKKVQASQDSSLRSEPFMTVRFIKKKMKKNSLITIPSKSEISSSEWLMLNQFLHEIKQINATCVSVYYQYGKGPEIILFFCCWR